MKIAKRFLTFFIPVILLFCACDVAVAQSKAMAQAHALFKQGKYAEAKAIYDKNLRQPGARYYSHQCKMKLAKGGPTNKIEASLASVKIPSVEFQEVPLGDALTYLTGRVKQLSNDKVIPNIIFNGDAKRRDETPITFKLTQEVPASVILKYIAQVGKCNVRYDQFAIMVTPNEKMPKPTVTAAQPAPAKPKVPFGTPEYKDPFATPSNDPFAK